MIGKGFMEVLLGVNILGFIGIWLMVKYVWTNEKILQLLMDRKVEKSCLINFFNLQLQISMSLVKHSLQLTSAYIVI